MANATVDDQLALSAHLLPAQHSLVEYDSHVSYHDVQVRRLRPCSRCPRWLRRG